MKHFLWLNFCTVIEWKQRTKLGFSRLHALSLTRTDWCISLLEIFRAIGCTEHKVTKWMKIADDMTHEARLKWIVRWKILISE